MQHRIRIGRFAAVTLTAAGVLALSGGTAVAASTSAVTKTFSFIAKPNSGAGKVIVNIDQLVINARCNSSGSPIVFAFSQAPAADIFSRVFDGAGRLHIQKNTSFNSKTKGLLLSPSSSDFDSTGTVLFETLSGKVVTLNIAFDNSTTLGLRR